MILIKNMKFCGFICSATTKKKKRWLTLFVMSCMYLLLQNLISKYIRWHLSPSECLEAAGDTGYATFTWRNRSSFRWECDGIYNFKMPLLPPAADRMTLTAGHGRRWTATRPRRWRSSGECHRKHEQHVDSYYTLTSVTPLGSLASCVACGLWLVTHSSVGHAAWLRPHNLVGVRAHLPSITSSFQV